MRKTRPHLVVAAVALLAACSPTIETHGDIPEAERLAQLQVGRTKSDVLTLLGTPSTTFNYGNERWYYISAQTEQRMFWMNTEIERQVIAVDFDKTGKVTQIRKLGLNDGKEVEMVSRTTPTTGQRQSLLGQLIGNVGRFENGQSPSQ